MVAKKIIPPDVLAEARRLYEQTLAPVGDIAELVGLSRSVFYDRARELGWRGRKAKPTFSFARAVSAGARLPLGNGGASAALPDAGLAEGQGPPEAPPEAPPERPPQEALPVTAQERAAVARRIMNAVEREMDAIERILKVITPADQLEAEHGARTLASLSRTLQEIAALNRPDDETPQHDTDDDEFPRDIDEFRNELARRINELVEARRERQGRDAGRPGGAAAAGRT